MPEFSDRTILTNAEKILLFGCLALLSLGLFSHLGYLELRGEEPRRAYVAMEMLFNGDFIHPTHYGLYYLNKPPLYMWILAGVFSVFDSMNEWVVRLPGVISFVLFATTAYFWNLKLYGQRIALICALAIITSSHLFFHASIYSGEIDFMFSTLVFLQAILFFHYAEQDKFRTAFLISYGIMILSFMLKGLPALLFGTLTILFYLLSRKRIKEIFSFWHLCSATILIAVIGAYFVIYENGDAEAQAYLAKLLFYEPGEKLNEDTRVGFWALNFSTFWLKFIYVFLPWSLFLIPGVLSKKARSFIRKDRWLSYSILFIAANIWVYWLLPGTKLRYLYPFIPFALSIAACILPTWKKFQFRHFLIFILIIATGRLIFNFLISPQIQEQRTYRRATSQISEICGNQMPILTGRGYTKELKVLGGMLSGKNIEPEPTPYQIPYYISRHYDKSMQFQNVPDQADQFYLGFVTQNREIEKIIYFTFFDKWTDRDMILFKIKE